MKTTDTRRWLTALGLVAVLLLAGCSKAAEQKHVIKEPVTIEKLDNGLGRLTLTEKAAERLGIETVVVEDVGGRRVIPSGAVIVGAEGGRYVYAKRGSLVFVREQIQVEHEDDGKAYLADGPAAGTPVVTIGAAELHGAETGIK